MEKVITGKIYDIQGFSVQDGPGIRLTVFLKGCPLRCPWCHSPESQEFPTEVNWMSMKCVGVDKCGKCITACTKGAISPAGTRKDPLSGEEIRLVTIDRTKCDDCGDCAKACVATALYMCGKDYTVEEVMERVRRDKPFFQQSGGGVTVSGGECLCQPAFTLALLKACKEEGVHTAVDTTGYVDYKIIKSVLPYTDLFLYDLKNMNSKLHERVIGVPNERILENAKRIAEDGGKFQIRIPVIPGFNESKAMFQQVGEFICSLGDAVEVVQLLPYHKFGTVKYERLQRNAPILEAEPPADELIQDRKKMLEDMGLTVTVH